MLLMIKLNRGNIWHVLVFVYFYLIHLNNRGNNWHVLDFVYFYVIHLNNENITADLAKNMKHLVGLCKNSACLK